MKQEISNFNGIMNTDATLENEETYYPLPDRRDGWQWKFSDGFSVVGVGGPENNLEETVLIIENPHGGNDTITRHITVAVLSFETVIWSETKDRDNANNWIVQQLSAQTSESQTQIADKMVKWINLSQDGKSFYGIRVFCQPIIQPGLPWWTIFRCHSGISRYYYCCVQDS